MLQQSIPIRKYKNQNVQDTSREHISSYIIRNYGQLPKHKKNKQTVTIGGC